MSQTYPIYGPPGTGKTTYLSSRIQAACERRGRDEVTVCSLTRAAARELKGRDLELPDGQLGTLHSLCFHALGRPELVYKHIERWNEEFPHRKLPLDTRASSIDTDDDLRRVGDEDEAADLLEEIHLKRALMVPREVWPDRLRSLDIEWEQWKEENELKDFTDLIEEGLEYLDAAPGRPSVLVGDEAQDWSSLELALFAKWGRKAEIVLMAGDPDQSIYAWRGANPRVFMDLDVPKENRQYLQKSYRLPSKPLEFSRRWISRVRNREDVEFEPARDGGSVQYLGCSYVDPYPIIDLVEKEIAQDRTVMILGTCGYILNPVISLLREAGIPFHNPYATSRGNFNPLQRKKRAVMPVDRVLSFVRPHEGLGEFAGEWDRDDLRKWMVVMDSKSVLAHGVKAFVQEKGFSVPPTYEEFEAMFQEPSHAEAAVNLDLDWFLSSLLMARRKSLTYPAHIVKKRGPMALIEKPKVVVGTIHSVKGAEADTVIVFPDLSRAGWDEYTGGGFENVARVFYVAFTRTKDKLFLCQPGNKWAVSW